MRLIPLGANGFFPTFGRQTMSFLVLAPAQALLLDAGTGVSRLIEPKLAELLEPYRSLDVILSHYHLDHVVGLSYMPAAWTHGRIRVFGPASPLVESEVELALDQLLARPLFPADYRQFPAPVEPVAFRGENLQIGNLSIRVRAQDHPGGSVGIRIGDELAYLTDTSVSAAAVDFVRGVKLLLHELWATDAEAATAGRGGHSHFSALAEFIRAAGVPVVMPVHHHPRRSDAEIRAMCEELQKVTGIRVLVSLEGEVVELDSL